jgi:transposase
VSQCTSMTVGFDIGDRSSLVCAIDAVGECVEESKVPTTKRGVEVAFARREPCLVVLEAGTHSPWISRQIESYGHEVVIANPRMLPLIYKSTDKDDSNDAERLARLGRSDRRLLSPLKHRSSDVQETLSIILARDALVRVRTSLINHCRGSVKSTGERLPRTGAERFHRLASQLPVSRQAALAPVMQSLEAISLQIKQLEQIIKQRCESDFAEDTSAMTQVGGVGPITALGYVTTLEDPNRFKKARDVAGYLGLKPRRARSGDSDPQLRITKAGNPYLRRLLVGSAQYILGPFGPDTDLRRWGMKLSARGGKNAKKRAVVAVARKLAVLLLKLWKTREVYEPLKNAERKAA